MFRKFSGNFFKENITWKLLLNFEKLILNFESQIYHLLVRSSQSEASFKKGTAKSFAKFTGNHLRPSAFL